MTTSKLHTTTSVSEGKRLQASASYNNVDGILHLVNKKLIFTAKGSKSPMLSVPVSDLKQFFVSKPDKPDPKLKIKLFSDVEHMFVFTTSNAKESLGKFKIELQTLISKQRSGHASNASSRVTSAAPSPKPRNGNAPSPSSGASSPALRKTAPTAEEIALRVELLSRNAELAKLHQELVVGRYITEEDFWETRKHLLRDEAAKTEQKKGRSSTVPDLKPVTEEGGDVKIKITPQIIHDIFEHYPSVKKAYTENVPHNLKEEEFWKRYFQSKFFHRNRSNADRMKNQQKDDIFDKCFAEDEDELVHGPKKRRLDRLNRLIDLSMTAEDHLESGNEPDITMQPGTGKSLTLLRKFNRHAERVLKSSLSEKPMKPKESPSDYTQKKGYKDEIIIEDLDADEIEPRILLNINDSRRYFESQTGTSMNDIGQNEQFPTSALTDMKALFADWHPDLRKPIRRSVSSQVTQMLNKAIKDRNNLNARQRNSEMKIPPALEQQVMNIHSASKEFLRHFWSTVNSAAPERIEKNKRMVEQIRKTLERIDEVAETAGEDGKVVRLMFKHMEAALKNALVVRQAPINGKRKRAQ